jgi:ABC-type cobalamin transport system ATPase subunit
MVSSNTAKLSHQMRSAPTLRVAVLEYLGQVVRDQAASPLARGQRVEELDWKVGSLRDLAEREAVDAKLGVVERHAQTVVAGELQRVRLDDEVLRLLGHHVLNDPARVLAAVLDQPVELGDCLVHVHCQHLRFISFLRRLLGRRLVVSGRLSDRVGAQKAPARTANCRDE